MAGITGDGGATLVGPKGPTGPVGPAGAQGITGDTGARGATLVGPSGPAGRTGVAGEQGVAGSAGAQGSTTAGVVGAVGSAGKAGPKGLAGAAGAPGPAGVVSLWTLYRDFRFDYNQSDLQSSETNKVSEIARYLQANPSLKVAIDGSMDPRGSDPRNQDLSDRRVSAIRDALVKAGVPATKIQMGAFGDTRLARDRRVAVLVCTAN